LDGETQLVLFATVVFLGIAAIAGVAELTKGMKEEDSGGRNAILGFVGAIVLLAAGWVIKTFILPGA
jgi:hypothetical protein